MKTKEVKVVQKENEESVPAVVIAQSIKNISDAVDKLDRSGLSEKAILLLLRDASGESMTSVKSVVWALRNLKRMYLKA